MTAADLPRLMEILREPEVARRWSEPDDASDRDLLAGIDADESEHITTFVITLNDETIFWIAGF